MKTIYLLAIIIELLNAQTYKDFAKVYGYETNYEKAYIKAKKEKKNILLITISSYCPWCKKLENQVLKDAGVQKKIQTLFVPVIINKDIDKLSERFITHIVPMSYIIDYKTEKTVKKRAGYQKKSDFMYFIKNAKMNSY